MWSEYWFVRFCCSKVSWDQSEYFAEWLWHVGFGLWKVLPYSFITPFRLKVSGLFSKLSFSSLATDSRLLPFQCYYAWAVLPGRFVRLDICVCMRRPTPVNAEWHSPSALLVLSAAVRAHQLEHTPGQEGKSNTQKTVMKYYRALCSMNSINSQTNNCFHYQSSV